MKVGIDRILVRLITPESNPLNMVDVSELPQEAEVISVGMDEHGLLEKLVKEKDIVVLTPQCMGIKIFVNKEELYIYRKHNIELIK